jgi:hypothetical protein
MLIKEIKESCFSGFNLLACRMASSMKPRFHLYKVVPPVEDGIIPLIPD